MVDTELPNVLLLALQSCAMSHFVYMNVHLLLSSPQNFGTSTPIETNFDTGRILIEGLWESRRRTTAFIVRGSDVG